MSIRDELYARYAQQKKEKEDKIQKITQEYEVEARDFIENNIIPQFREQGSCYPNKIIFSISFINEETHFKNLDNPDELIKYEIVLAATKISSEYDIKSSIKYSLLEEKIDAVIFFLSIL